MQSLKKNKMVTQHEIPNSSLHNLKIENLSKGYIKTSQSSKMN